MFKTGITSISFRGHSVDEIIAAAAAAGLDGIEWGSDVHVPAGDVATAKTVKEKTEAAGLQVLSYGGYYKLGSGDAAGFAGLLDCAAALGVRDVRIWGGDKNSADLTDAEWDALVADAKACAAAAAGRGMVLSLECHNNSVTDDYTAALRFLQAVDSSALRMYWQPNQLKGEVYDLAALRALAPLVTNIHVFSWTADRRHELAVHNPQWHKYLTLLEQGLAADEAHALLLEFMPDDKLETLAQEAWLLRRWMWERGHRVPASTPETELVLLPRPRSIQRAGADVPFEADGTIQLDSRELYPYAAAARRRRLAGMKLSLRTVQPAAVVLTKDERLPSEGYALSSGIAEGDITGRVFIRYADAAGAFYALGTLEQLLTSCGGLLPQVEIQDSPDYPVRGYMLDVGRNRIMTRGQLFDLADKLAGWKINHLELYMEGVPFEYPSFPEMWAGRELLTGEDILALDAYCRDRCIELVPNQNNFGHMDVWLKEKYRHLAECPDGFTFQGMFLPDPRCLNPNDPGSFELVQKLAADLLPYFSSKKYNISCDETLELGQGASKAACDERGMVQVYADFVIKVCEVAAAHGRTPLLWDDVIKEDPSALQRLPKEAVLLDWGYEACQPSVDNLKMLQELGCNYYVCPGTGSWNAYIGMTDKMLANIARAARLGRQYGARGLLNTDWGDAGHLQAISSCYAGVAYGGAMAWCVDANEEMELAAALNVQVFEDAAGVMGDFVLDAGRYQRYEGKSTGNSTLSMRLLFSAGAPEWAADVDPASFVRMRGYLAAMAAQLKKNRMACADAQLVLDEYRWGLDLMDAIQMIGMAASADVAGKKDEARESWLALRETVPALVKRFERVWAARCRQSWLDESLKQFAALQERVEKALAE